MVRALIIPQALRHRPFLVTEAYALGLTSAALRGQRFRRLFTGVYVCADLPLTPGLRVDAARLLLREPAAASHHTAAELLSLPVPASSNTHLVVPAGARRHRIAGIQVHRMRSAFSVREIDGRCTMTPAATFLALASHLTLVDLVILGDAIVRRGHETPQNLSAQAAAAAGRHIRRARHAAALVRPRIDSPMETRLRLLLVLSGLPEPRVNLPIHATDGRWLARPDLHYWPERVVIEYDGRHHIERERQWERDLARRERMERHGWRVIIVTAKDIYGNPAGVVRRVADALGVPADRVVTGRWWERAETSNE